MRFKICRARKFVALRKDEHDFGRHAAEVFLGSWLSLASRRCASRHVQYQRYGAQKKAFVDTVIPRGSHLLLSRLLKLGTLCIVAGSWRLMSLLLTVLGPTPSSQQHVKIYGFRAKQNGVDTS